MGFLLCTTACNCTRRPCGYTEMVEESVMHSPLTVLSDYIFTQINNSTPAAAPASPCSAR